MYVAFDSRWCVKKAQGWEKSQVAGEHLRAAPSLFLTRKNTQAQTHTPRNKGAILLRKGQQFSSSDRGLFLVRGCCPISGHPPLAPSAPSGPHHPGDKLPIVPALLINDSSPV